MMKKIAVFVLLCAVTLGLTAMASASDYSILRPVGVEEDPDVKAIKSIHHKKNIPTSPGRAAEILGTAGIIDTLTWRAEGASTPVNFGFTSPGDSMLVWLEPAAACSLIAIRFQVINFEGNMLFDIWDARNAPMIYSEDSTDAAGWIGTYEPITNPAGWVPGDIVGRSPLGLNANDDDDHFWGPFPFSVTGAHADEWVEIPASYGLQGEVDLGSDPFYIGAVFYRTAGWGFYSQYPYTGSVPYNFFKFYAAGTGPDATHDGWFIRSYLMWFEAVVLYYENTPPTYTDLSGQNYTYAPGPFPITVTIKDQDAENEANAGVTSAELVFRIDDGEPTRVPMEGPPEGGLYTGTIPEIAKGQVVTYWIEATDPPGLTSSSSKITFGRIEPVHPTADILVIWDYTGDADLDTFLVDLFASLSTQYEYELWNNPDRNGIDASVLNYGWNTIYISGWGCGNTLPGADYAGNPFVEWLEAGTTENPHNLLYIDQDYFCIHLEYDCPWDQELSPGEFMYDYFGVVEPVSDNHGAEDGGYDTTAVGVGDFEGIRVNFHPTHWWPAQGATTPPENAQWPDWLVALTEDAEEIFQYHDTGFGAGSRLNRGHYRTVFLPWADFFAVDSLENGDLVPRPGLTATIGEILNWFGTGTGANSTETPAAVPRSHSLAQNYPNPFNPVTTIHYSVASNVHTSLKVYNVLGQEVATLVNELKEPGTYTASWDARDMASGVYFYRLAAGDYSTTRRMVLLK